jgi:cellobiose phosphorylase
VAATQWILGIRPTFSGLKVSPIIPEEWPGFSARRIFREVTYHITVERKGRGNAITMTVDGKPIEGDIIPFPSEGTKSVLVQGMLR